ncbi:MAG TPA: helix-turn-helix domain-containing protein [Archaeoglobus profundus]|nr:helix-turn-helix domain-containing protein [Archaeoglobus profundus]HIP58503.1 helix-turn-helix domain-containing protein [Archaeoglobus profundus]
MDSTIKALMDKISGEIVFSDAPGKTIKKWRQIFGISQKELALKLGVSPSVISDYESDRRKSPGINFIRRIIEAMIEIDKERGYKTISKYRDLIGFNLDVIIDMKEFDRPLHVKSFAEIIEGEMLTNFEKYINGYTIVDSIKAILTLNAYDFYKLYGFTTERALIFTKVSTGRSPMVAVRVANLKPSVVVLHGIDSKRVDEIAVKLAEIERIPLIATQMPLDDMIKVLRRVVA